MQLAKRRGAEVFATAGGERKAAIVRALGADLVISYQEQDSAEAVLDATHGNGVDVVYDAVGHATFAGSLAATARRGTLVNYGAASGMVTVVDPLDLAEAGSVFFTRPHMAHYMQNRDEIRARAGEMFELAAGDHLDVAIDRLLPFETATTGKLLLATA